MCLSLFSVGFILFGTLWASCTRLIFFLSCVGGVFDYIPFKKFLRPFLFSSSWTAIIQMLVNLMMAQKFWDYPQFFHSFPFILFFSSYIHHSIFCSLIHSSASVILLLIPSKIFFNFTMSFISVYSLFPLGPC